MGHRSAYGFGPGSEGAHYEIIKAAYCSAYKQDFCVLAVALSADKNLCGGCSLRERILAILLFHEIFTEWDEEKYAQNAAQERAEEDLCEVHRQFGIFCL